MPSKKRKATPKHDDELCQHLPVIQHNEVDTTLHRLVGELGAMLPDERCRLIATLCVYFGVRVESSDEQNA